MSRRIYLDNSTVARPSHKTISSMMPFFDDLWGSPLAPHDMGQELFPYVEENYRLLYSLFGASEYDEVILTSSGAEAVNHAIFSTYYDVTRTTGKNQFIVSSSDEAPALLSIGRLESMGCVAKVIPCGREGAVTASMIADAVSPRTALVSLSWVNGLTGVINPIAEVAQLCRERGIIFHVDATHALGKVFFDLEEVGAHFISCNGEQLHAPKGSGALYIKQGHRCSPFILGGMEQGGLRAGTLNVAALAGLGHAAKETLDSCDLLGTEVARLRDKLERGILKGYPGAVAFFQEYERVPSITAIAFPPIRNEALLFALNRKHLYATIGGGSMQQIALVLEAAGVDKRLAETAISFSLSRNTTEEEVDHAIDLIVETATKLRKVAEKMSWD